MGQQSPATPPRQPFLLGEWHVEPALDRISRGREVVRVPPRAMQVLLCLVDRGGQVVTKRQLIDAVWDEECVTEGALTRCVAILRRILGDDAGQPRYVENVPRRGYRLVMPTRPPSDDREAACGSRPSSCWLSFGQRRFDLAEGENVIGRAQDAAVHIDHKNVSRHHARIRVAGARATVEDLGSRNGTFLGGRRLETACDLHDGDAIGIGSVTLVFRVFNPQGSTEAAPAP
jgi:DNA-binding winged helix-turn-helix (wHTH) protein